MHQTGALKFNKTIAAPSGNVTLSVAAAVQEDRVITIWSKELTPILGLQHRHRRLSLGTNRITELSRRLRHVPTNQIRHTLLKRYERHNVLHMTQKQVIYCGITPTRTHGQKLYGLIIGRHCVHVSFPTAKST